MHASAERDRRAGGRWINTDIAAERWSPLFQPIDDTFRVVLENPIQKAGEIGMFNSELESSDSTAQIQGHTFRPAFFRIIIII